MGTWIRSRLGIGSSGAEEDARHVLGRLGEQAAARYLKRSGFRVLYRNFRAHGGGEVDIVCRERGTETLVFIEVKTRTSLQWGDPSAAVDEKKRRLILRGALEWLRMLGFPEIRTRFDILEIVGEADAFEFNLVRNAFGFPENYYP